MALADAQNTLTASGCITMTHRLAARNTGDPRGNYPTNYLMALIGRVPPDSTQTDLLHGSRLPRGRLRQLAGEFRLGAEHDRRRAGAVLADRCMSARQWARRDDDRLESHFTQYTSSDPMAGYAFSAATAAVRLYRAQAAMGG